MIPRPVHTLMIALLLAASLRADEGPPKTELTPDARKAVIEAISRSLIDGYIYEETAKKMAAALREHAQAGRYDGLKGRAELAARLTEDLQKVSKDLHLRILNDAPAPAGPNPPPRRQPPSMKEFNYGFARVEVLSGNIGYLRLTGFIGVDEGFAKADAAMALLADVDGLIIDLRQNGGGNEAMVKHLSTYLFDEPTHLVNTFTRGMEKPRERWTLKEVRGKRLAKVPTCILVSRQTFSAAESFTFGLKVNQRATVVGERTGGGGHFGEVRPLIDGFSIWLPRGRTYDPKTGEGWEAAGIKPDVEVPAAKALDAALERLKRSK